MSRIWGDGGEMLSELLEELVEAKEVGTSREHFKIALQQADFFPTTSNRRRYGDAMQRC
jgi:hypothetical protein